MFKMNTTDHSNLVQVTTAFEQVFGQGPNTTNKRNAVSCGCKTGNCVNDRRCKCSVNKTKCNSHCHPTNGPHNCKNCI